MSKLRTDKTQEMLAVVRSRIFCLLVCYPKIQILNEYKNIDLPIVLYGVKLGLSH
jgi:hypothetical protein